MKTILFIHHESGIGGAPISMINIIENLDKTKFKTKVILLKNSIITRILEDKNIDYDVVDCWFYRRFYKYFTHIIPSYIKWYQPLTFLKCTLSWILSRYYFANRILEKYDCDIIHLNSSVLTDWLAPSKQRAKVIIHIREPFATGYLGIRSHLFRRQMKKYASRILGISNDNCKRINILSNSVMVYNFVNDEYFSNIPADSNSKVVIYVGGQAKIKGFKTVVKALDYLDSGISVLFVGSYNDFSCYAGIKGFIKRTVDPKYKLLLKMRSSKNSIEIGIKTDIYELIKDSLILISPFSKEHFSRPIIEAFAASRAAIGSNVEGMDEIIDDQINGLITEKNSEKKLANAINYLCSNPNVAIQMGINGYKKAMKYYTSENVKKIESVYFEILKENKIVRKNI